MNTVPNFASRMAIPVLEACVVSEKSCNINMEENGIRWFPRASNSLESGLLQPLSLRISGKPIREKSISYAQFWQRMPG